MYVYESLENHVTTGNMMTSKIYISHYKDIFDIISPTSAANRKHTELFVYSEVISEANQ